MATPEELRGFTIERLRELCAERHIAVQARNKEELIAALTEKMSESGEDRGAAGTPATSELFGFILQMQRDQMNWMEAQQRRQELWMSSQQRSQEEMLDALRERQERERIAVEESRRRARLPKPTLQRFAEGDDVESYLDMFERVATQQEWPKETWAAQLAGLLSGNALDGYSALPSSSAKDYETVKTAVLERYDVNAETYRQRFRSESRKPTESYRNFAERL